MRTFAVLSMLCTLTAPPADACPGLAWAIFNMNIERSANFETDLAADANAHFMRCLVGNGAILNGLCDDLKVDVVKTCGRDLDEYIPARGREIQRCMRNKAAQSSNDRGTFYVPCIDTYLREHNKRDISQVQIGKPAPPHEDADLLTPEQKELSSAYKDARTEYLAIHGA